MVKVIGKNDCSRCEMTKNILNSKGIPFEYIMNEDLSEEERKEYMNMAKKQGLLSYPIIIKDNTVVTLQQI